MSDQTTPAAEPAAEPQANAPEPGQGTEQQSNPLDQINDRLKEWGDGLPNMVAEAVAAQQGYDPYDQGYDPYGQQAQQGYPQQAQQGYPQPEQQDPYGGLDPNDPIQAQLIEARSQIQEMQQGLQGIQRDGWNRDLQGVLGQYPEINPQSDQHNPAAAQAVIQNVQALGFDPSGLVPPRAIELAYKAYRADQIAGQQKPVDDGQQVVLEGGQAQAQQPEQDPIEAIFGAPGQAPNSVFGWAVK